MIARLIVGNDEVKAHVPFDLKDIPKSFPGRKWDPTPTNKCWIMPVRFVDDLADALRAAGVTVYITRADGSPWRSGRTTHGHRSTPAAGWADALFTAVGPNRVEPVFRAMSRIIHQDAGGGDTRLMQELNAARERAAFSNRQAS